MQIRPFLDILPSLYDHWGTTAMQPKKAEPFREILEKVEQPTTANFLQLLTSAAEYLEQGEVICEVGCWHGANLIGVLVDRPDRLAYGIDFFSTQAEVAENKIELLQGNLETFGVAEQFCFSHQIIDDFFADLRDIGTEDKFGLYVYSRELRLVYSGAIALVYPSKYEGFGMPVLEAMACGCPVITTPNASLPEVGGNAVIYVNDNDVAGMIDALRQVLNSEIRQHLVQAGLKQCRQFSWSTMAEKVQNVLLKVAN